MLVERENMVLFACKHHIKGIAGGGGATKDKYSSSFQHFWIADFDFQIGWGQSLKLWLHKLNFTLYIKLGSLHTASNFHRVRSTRGWD